MIEQKFQMMSLADAGLRIDREQPLMTDTETVGFYGKIRLVQFFQNGWDIPIMVEWPNAFELAALLEGCWCVGHNFAYDISTVQDQMGKIPWQPKKYDDTLLLSRLHFYMQEGFSLDKVVCYTLGHNPYLNNDQQLSDWGVPVLSPEQLSYAADDVVYLLAVWNACKGMCDDYSYRLDLLMTRYCMEFQVNGIPVDIDVLRETYAANMAKIKSFALPINCNSYVQVRPYIGSNESDDLGLAKQVHQGNQRAKVVREVRKLTKQNSFLCTWEEVQKDSVLYGHFKVGARSGRTTCSDENLQQLARALKKCFGVPEDGNEVVVYSDFSQIQMRGVCVVAGDTAMEKIFRKDIDVHNYVMEMTADTMPYGESLAGDAPRQIAKGENYTLLFGAGPIVLNGYLVTKADMWLPEDILARLIKGWKSLWKQVKDWQDKGAKDWRKKVAWETPLGRRYVAKMMTDQLAMQIQGFEAEVAKLATHYMLPKIEEYNNRVLADLTGMPLIKLRNFMHDSYFFTCPKIEEHYKWLCKTVADAMQEAWTELCKECELVRIKDLPMPVKVRVGYNWADIDKNDVFIYEHKQ